MIEQFIHGNSIEVVKSFENDYVHSIISDIPYGICYNEWDVLHNNTNTALEELPPLKLKRAGFLNAGANP